MANEIRREAQVIGPGTPGKLRVQMGRSHNQFIIEIPAKLLPASLRMPNSQFVAVTAGRDFVRVEPAGHVWLTIQDQIRSVLNKDWDPIGVADRIDDEYDMYIGRIYSLLSTNATEKAIADYLSWVESDRMETSCSSNARLVQVVANLRSLRLPQKVALS